MKEPKVKVGIMAEPEIRFVFHDDYFFSGNRVSGEHRIFYSSGKIIWNGNSYESLNFEPSVGESSSFELFDVTIGVNFHWERKENQLLKGGLNVIVSEGKLVVINIVRVEDYLMSVISSEMNATASLELLKAHAVISRSWLLAQIQVDKNSSQKELSNFTIDNDELIKWYDREDHQDFDICADDHCQRYQGITRASTKTVEKAVADTYGQVLMYDNQICDARFSKCCGGAFEEFQYCWEDIKHPYLVKQRDSKINADLPDLRNEIEADRWIRSTPEAFCNTHDKKILSQVLNNYDQETKAFFRWKVIYTQKELSLLVMDRSKIDFGLILELIPVERGTSGRLSKLKIVGTKRSMIIGKELEIRRILSPSHLYSSAFVIDRENENFILTGAGWGHGVGLCQIGAAVMGENGYEYDNILLHYYVGATVTKLY